MTDDAKAIETGRRVLAAFDEGRRIAIEQQRRRASHLRDLVEAAAQRDAEAGKSEYGRAARVARELRTMASRSAVYRSYAALFSAGQNE